MILYRVHSGIRYKWSRVTIAEWKNIRRRFDLPCRNGCSIRPYAHCRFGIFMVLWIRDPGCYDFPTRWRSPSDLRSDVRAKCTEAEAAHFVTIIAAANLRGIGASSGSQPMDGQPLVKRPGSPGASVPLETGDGRRTALSVCRLNAAYDDESVFTPKRISMTQPRLRCSPAGVTDAAKMAE